MNTITYLNSKPYGGARTLTTHFGDLRTTLYSMGICWVDSAKGKFALEHTNATGLLSSFRVILYADRSRANYENPMVHECNGLVLLANVYSDRIEWEILARAMPTLNQSQYSIKRVIDLCKSGAYDVYEALDSTVINLYQFASSWRISTTKGYDVTNLQMCEGYTYLEVFTNILENKYKQCSLEKLDRRYTYTFSLRYSGYHIFVENRTNPSANTYITLMQVTDPITGAPVDGERERIKSLGMYLYYPIKHSRSGEPTNPSVLLNNCKSSFAKYDRAVSTKNHKLRPVYGYVLRSTSNRVPLEYQNIYLESSLMKLIRNGLYRSNHEYLRDGDLRMITISLFMNRSYYPKYSVVFHQFKDEFESLEFIIGGLAQAIASSLTNTSTQDHEPVIADFISTIVEQMRKDLLVDGHEQQTESIASLCLDYIYNPKYRVVLERIIANSDLVKLVT